jgi:four helix bundle protein
VKVQTNENVGRLPAGKRQTPNVKRQTPNDSAASGSPVVFDLEERLLQYASRVIRLVDSLFSTKSASHVGGQLLRSGTSPLSNHGEAQAAESIEDFIHKLKICLKELHESRRWLRLIHSTPLVAKPRRMEPLIDETVQLIRIFSKSLQTAEGNRDNRVREEPSDPAVAPWLILWPSTFDVWRLAFGVKPPAGPPRKPVTYVPKERALSRSKSP